MALWMRLMLNDHSIGYLEARRRDHRHPPGEDDVCLYDWTVSLGRDDIRSSVHAAPLAHRYGDGAWALVTKILGRAGHLPTELIVEDQWPPLPDTRPPRAADSTGGDYTAPLEPLQPLEILDPDACVAAAQRLARRTYLTRREATIARALNTPEHRETP